MRTSNKILLSDSLEIVFKTPDGTGSWFGYYNYDTLNYNQTKMLCQRNANDAQIIKRGMTVEVGYYDIPSGDWHTIGVSDSFNWAQGCMAQWLPGVGNENKVIYNLSKDNRLVSCIQDINTGYVKQINWPIYGLTPDGKKSITIDLERSYWCRAYHYESVINENLNVPIPPGDGIFEIDLIKNERKLIISLEDIIQHDKHPSFDRAKHWIEHIMISPSGKRFCFLHRFSYDNVYSYQTRLFVANIDGTNLTMIDGWKKFQWSHFGWDRDDAFAIYSYLSSYQEPSLNNVNYDNNKSIKIIASNFTDYIKGLVPDRIKNKIKMLKNGQTTYYQYYKLKDVIFELVDEFKLLELAIDGHPSFTNDGCYMITDTYPDYSQYQHLIVYNVKTRKAVVLAKIYAGLHNLPGSCDLHPKLCKNNNYLAVDSAYDGSHHMILFKLNWDYIKEKTS